MSLRKYGTCAAICIVAMVSAADAASVRWSLQDFTFDDGAEATGYFDWDTVAEAVTDFDIGVTDGTDANFGATTYQSGIDSAADFAGSGSPHIIRFESASETFPSHGGARQFRISAPSIGVLSTPAAPFSPVPDGFFVISAGGFLECYGCSPVNPGQAGATLTGELLPEPNVVPLPAGGGLLLGGLALMALARGRGRTRAPSAA